MRKKIISLKVMITNPPSNGRLELKSYSYWDKIGMKSNNNSLWIEIAE